MVVLTSIRPFLSTQVLEWLETRLLIDINHQLMVGALPDATSDTEPETPPADAPLPDRPDEDEDAI